MDDHQNISEITQNPDRTPVCLHALAPAPCLELNQHTLIMDICRMIGA